MVQLASIRLWLRVISLRPTVLSDAGRPKLRDTYDGSRRHRIRMSVALMVANTLAAGFDDPDKVFGRLEVINRLFGALVIGALLLLIG